MQIFFLVLFGFLAGVIGGMGMGGGTVLVPLLSFLDISQKNIQAINLISFLPMCIVALFFHSKNGLIKKQHTGWVVIPATLFSALGAYLAGGTSNNVLKLCFAVFLIVVGAWQLFVAVKFLVSQKRNIAPQGAVQFQSRLKLKKHSAFQVLYGNQKGKKEGEHIER